MSVSVGRSRVPSVTARKIVTQSRWDLLPQGHRVFGVNINCYPSPQDGGGPTGHPTAVSDWWRDWQWDTVIRPMLDAAADYGFNAIRFFLPTASRYQPSGYTPQIDMQAFLRQLRQLMVYAANRGIRSYPCLCVESQMFSSLMPFLPPIDWVIREYTIVCRFLSHYASIVFGVDLCNEQGGWATTNGQGEYVYRAIKPIAPNLTFTWSNASPFGYQPARAFDHGDGHIYQSGIQADFHVALLKQYGALFLIGEYGDSYQAGVSDRAVRFGQVRAMVENTDPEGRHVAGAMVWDIYSSWGGDGNWGILNNDLTPRTDVQAVLQGSPR